MLKETLHEKPCVTLCSETCRNILIYSGLVSFFSQVPFLLSVHCMTVFKILVQTKEVELLIQILPFLGNSLDKNVLAVCIH